MYLYLFFIFAFSLQFETILAVPRPYSGHHLADSFCCRSARRLWSWRRRLFTIHHGETCLSERRAPQTDRTHSLTGQHCLVQATLHGGQRQGDAHSLEWLPLLVPVALQATQDSFPHPVLELHCLVQATLMARPPPLHFVLVTLVAQTWSSLGPPGSCCWCLTLLVVIQLWHDVPIF